MGNHYHLLLETPEPNLVRGMTWFQTTYTVRYNVRHHTSGHLFGGRYKAVLVEAPEDGSAGDGDYFTTLVDYIHLNPVRAGLIDVSEEGLPEVDSYRWSSLPEYRKKRSARPEFLETALGFGSLNLKDGPAGRRQFVERVARRAQVEKQEECGLAEIAGQGAAGIGVRTGSGQGQDEIIARISFWIRFSFLSPAKRSAIALLARVTFATLPICNLSATQLAFTEISARTIAAISDFSSALFFISPSFSSSRSNCASPAPPIASARLMP